MCLGCLLGRVQLSSVAVVVFVCRCGRAPLLCVASMLGRSLGRSLGRRRSGWGRGGRDVRGTAGEAGRQALALPQAS